MENDGYMNAEWYRGRPTFFFRTFCVSGFRHLFGIKKQIRAGAVVRVVVTPNPKGKLELRDGKLYSTRMYPVQLLTGEVLYLEKRVGDRFDVKAEVLHEGRR